MNKLNRLLILVSFSLFFILMPSVLALEELKLDNETYENLADIDMADSEFGPDIHFQTRWNITGIPSGIVIKYAEYCAYIWNTLTNNNANVWRITNQTWGESITTTEYDAMTNGSYTTDKTWNETIANNYSCINITSQLEESYSASDDNLTLRFEDPDETWDGGAFLITDNTNLRFGLATDIFLSRETSPSPYINMTYEYGSYPQWFDNQSSLPSEYAPDRTLDFNITWNSSDSSVSSTSTVYIETNITGTSTNYTASNVTYGSGIYNLTRSFTIYGLAQYYWKSWANESINDLWNESDTWYFTIAQNTSNPTHTNITISGFSYIDQNRASTSEQSITLNGHTNYSNAGTVEIYVSNIQYTIPDTRTWGAGTWTVLVNTSGNANYSANSTGKSVTLTITAPTGGGGGGGSGFYISPPVDCNASIYPSHGMSGSAQPGEDIAPFEIRIYNKNVSQSFSVSFTDNEIKDYCEIDFGLEVEIPPYGQDIRTIRCVAPNNTVTSNVQLISSLGCIQGLPITISPSLDIFSDLSNAIKLLVSGQIWASMWYPIMNIPFIIVVIVAIIVLYAILRLVMR